MATDGHDQRSPAAPKSVSTASRRGRDRPMRVLFVCLGNICRSPLAEGLFRKAVDEAGLSDRFEIASAGTGPWHVGEAPDRRMRDTARRRGVSLDDLRGRQVKAPDLAYYDLVLAMDREVLHDTLYLDPTGDHSSRVRLFREFDPEPGDYQVPDPYYGGPQGFDEVYEMVERTAKALLERSVNGESI
jgi:protein-tyrosine phosphatase